MKQVCHREKMAAKIGPKCDSPADGHLPGKLGTNERLESCWQGAGGTGPGGQ